MTDLERKLALSLFAEGFAHGVAEVTRGARRPPHRARGQEHVTAGLWAGREAAEKALAGYSISLERKPSVPVKP